MATGVALGRLRVLSELWTEAEQATEQTSSSEAPGRRKMGEHEGQDLRAVCLSEHCHSVSMAEANDTITMPI